MQDGANAKQQIVEKLKSSTNILVTVSTNPSVDELSSALGLTLMLNKMDKHATAVFSGAIPPAIEFLNPEKTLENTVNSLRDFIIALDKEKADRLRYKVDGDMVRIFITPYRTTISEKDLEFSQGDFNVETIVALGVERREELDKAIAAHGRILHDATVVTINTKAGEGDLGAIDWQDANASSLCEMLMSLSEALKGGIIDEQIATALLTGIVAATNRFSNNLTKPRIMTMAAQLMAAGANQQLIATKLEGDNVIRPAVNNDGSTNLEEDASAKLKEEEKKAAEKSQAPAPAEEKKPDGEIHIDHQQPPANQPPQPNMMDANVAVAPEAIQQKKEQAAVDAAEEALATALPQQEQLPQHEKTLAELERDLETEKAAASQPPQPQAPPAPEPPASQEPKRELVSEAPSWMSRPMEPPTMGGTLSATSAEALRDKLRSEEEDRNQTLLSHDHQPSRDTTPFVPPSPDNETQSQPSLPPAQPASGLPTLDTSFAPPPPPSPTPPPPEPAPAAPAEPNYNTQPPAPAPTPNAPQASSDDGLNAARDAVNDALNVPQSFEQNTQPPPPQTYEPPVGDGFSSAPTSAGASGAPAAPTFGPPPPMQSPIESADSFLPTPPPLPEMGSLPPLPPTPDQTMPNQGPSPLPTSQTDPFSPPPMQTDNGSDPGQFKIPGQQ